MLLHVFAMPQSEKEMFLLEAVRMTNFKIEHDAEDEHPNLILSFTAYIPRTGKVLKFADDNFGSSIFIKYEAAQASLLDDNPNIQPIDEPKPEPAPGNDDGGGSGDEAEDEDEAEGGGNGGDEEEEGDQQDETVLNPPHSPSEPPLEEPAPIHAAATHRRRRAAPAATQEHLVQ